MTWRIRATRDAGSDHQRAFELEEELLRLDSAAIPDEGAVRAEDAVARNNDRDGVRRIGPADCLETPARPDTLGELLVCNGGTVWYAQKLLPDADLEGRSDLIHGNRELRKLPVEVPRQLINNFLVARLVVGNFTVIEIIAQPAEKIPLGLTGHTDLADALLR